MLNDPLANALSKIKNAEKLGKNSCSIAPSSKVIKEVFRIMQENKFIGEFKETDNGKGGIIKIELIGKINNCGVIKPHYSAKQDGFEKFEKRYLPAKNFGIIIVSTPQGIMTQQEAAEKNSGGVLLAYCY
ncbi:MAG: 30S ribosomal protein S8 [Candidatus Woesearchaeota archaeon]